MLRLPRRVSVVMTVCAVLVTLCGGVVAADPVRVADFDPDPTGDTYLDQRFDTEGLPHGTILSSRRVDILPPLAVTSSFDAWQVWFSTSAADGSPIAAITTIMKPHRWNGRVVSNNYAIDSVGLKCNPSYQLTHEVSIEAPDTTRQLLSRGYAVVMTDYQGPKMAYAHGPTQAREVLDGLRAALALPDAGLADSPVAMIGYSGGAIATVWAAQTQSAYAPELNIVGAAAGGTPADLRLLRETMDGKPPAAGLYLLAALGIARVTPGALDLLNEAGKVTAKKNKNLCFTEGAIAGLAPLPLKLFTSKDVYETPVVQRVYRETTAGAVAPTMPIYLWHGKFDEWIPAEGARALAQSWRDKGADVTLDMKPCEHLTCAFVPDALDAVDRWMSNPD
ncbi:lipase family protein [Nocardia callitridis]|uniref:Lipase family protein n=1 Tax=Nocardia callitridis TaxID=648753 RepID=A0ABP9K871_9NOCA